ncbi:DMT family transporter [Crossiella cryophila]|uniref:DMT family transporter n=1 Tax=Crossiella cryophila TaxID=43355 RepID=UPI0031E54E75
MTTAAPPRTSPPQVSPRAKLLGLLGAAGIGVLIVLQSRLNGELGRRMQDGIGAALISFGSGLLLVVALVLVLVGSRRATRRVGAALRTGELRWWQTLGGLCGALLVFSQGVAVAALGVAVFTVAVVAGQALSSLAVDRAGLGPAGPQPLTATRIAGALLAVAAVLVAVSERLGNPGTLALAVLPLLAGIGMAWQQAQNGQVKEVAGAALPAALVNFLAGTAALLVLGVIHFAAEGLPAELPGDPLLYLGGVVGVAFIAGAAALVRVTGVLLLGLGSVAGQLLGALALDLLFPAADTHLSWVAVTGTLLTLLAVGVAALPKRG